MIESEVLVDIRSNRLAGTLCLPGEGNNRYPMLLFIHGSGPLDRDENTRGMKLNVFNTVAHHLADFGIGSLRYDKRGCGKSTGDYMTAGHQDLVDDAQGMLDHLRRQTCTESGQLFLLGHSEGSIIAPQVVAAEHDLAGIVLLKPFAQAMHEVLLAQASQMQKDIDRLRGIKVKLVRLLTALFGSPESQKAELINRITNSDTAVVRYKLRSINARWLRELFALDIQSIYSRVDCPALVIGGVKDIQCDPADVALIGKWMGPEAETVLLEDLSHILRREPSTPSLFNYRRLMKQEIEPEVLSRVQRWICLLYTSDAADDLLQV